MQNNPKHNIRNPRNAPWLAHYPACVPTTLEYPKIPAWGLLEQTAKSYPDREACIYYKQHLTYRELHEQARCVAHMLVRMGVQPGDRVAIMLPNMPETLATLNGIWMAGGIVVALSPLMVPSEVSAMLRVTDCRVVVSLDLLAPLVTRGDFRPEHVIFTTMKDRLPHWQRLGYAFAKICRLGFWLAADAPNQHFYEDELVQSDRQFQPVEPDSIDDPAFILPTGGTTGRPKAVTLTHRNLVANAWQLLHWAGKDIGKHKILSIVPFFHSYGMSTCVMNGAAMAATLVLHHRFIPRVALRLIEEHQPSVFPAVPAMLTALNELLRRKPIDFKELRYCISGGAPLDPAIANEFAEHSGATVVEGYGLSEASPVTHTGPLDGTNRLGTIGLPMPDTEARIVDEETGVYTLAPSKVGELVIRGPQVMAGYWKDPEATAAVIRDGWLHTGDLATCDEDGFFRIVDRIKDLIITSGFNVYPTDVEHVLRQCPGVADVAVIGFPDPGRGEIVKAVIETDPNVTFNQKHFNKFASENLAKHKRPSIVEILNGDLPRKFLGKVLRRELREQHAAINEVETATVAESTA